MSNSAQVTDASAGERLDRWLAEVAGISRDYAKRVITEGRVQRGDSVLQKASERVAAGDTIQWVLPEPEPADIPATDGLPLRVVYEDDALIIIDKPIGMLTHPTGRRQTDTLVNALVARYGSAGLSSINGILRPGIVHRLDRDTEGLMVVARTAEAHQHLAAQLKQRSLHRTYLAIVQGDARKKLGAEAGTWCNRLARNPNRRDAMQVVTDTRLGREAMTHWHVEDTLGSKFSKLRLQLETGRTHQIRVQAAYHGLPLVGDLLYGTGFEQQQPEPALKQGQLLVAFELALIHPVSQQALHFQREAGPRMAAAWAYLSGLC